MRSEIRWIQRERGEEEVEEGRRKRKDDTRNRRKEKVSEEKDDGDKGEKAKWRKKLISPTNSKILSYYLD